MPQTSPDDASLGFLNSPPKAMRYDNQSEDPDDAAMKLVSLLPSGLRVLDVGCGTGSVTEIIVKNARADIVGLEPDRERVLAARQRGLRIVEGLLTEDFLKEHGPFDCVVFADVLEHLPSPAKLVLTAKQGLTPGGFIIASVPNIAHWFVRLALLRGNFRYEPFGIMDATHLRWFTHDTLHSFFDNLGFRVTQHTYTVNTKMVEYQRLKPWCWIPTTTRLRLVRRLVRAFPTLFGCQHVVRVDPT